MKAKSKNNPSPEDELTRLRKRIAELEAAETVHKQLEHEFEKMFNFSLDLIAVGDYNGYLKRVNSSFEKLLGYTKEELLSNHYSSFVHPDDRDYSTNETENTLYQGKLLQQFQNRWIGKDGTGHWIDWMALPDQIDEEVFMIGRDITERKQAEVALRISEEHYRALVSNIPGAIYIGDADWTITFASPAFEDIIGYPVSDIINNNKRTYASIVYPDDLKYLEDEISKAYKEKRNNLILEYRIIHQKGDIRWVSDRVALLKGEDGEEKGFEGLVINITESKQAEEALKESEERLSSILDKSPIPTAVGGYDGSIISFNNALEEMIGYKQEEIRDINEWENKLYPDDGYRELVHSNISQALEGEKQESTEFTITCKDGTKKEAAFYTSFYSEGIIIQMVDITERKQAEEKDRQSKILLESSIESPKDMIILSLDREYRYLFFNQAHRAAMDNVFSTQPQIGDCIFDHITGKDDIEKVKAHYDRALAGDAHVAIEEYGEDQLRYYYEIRYSPIYDDNNEIIGITSFAEDITERRKAESRLARLSSIVEQSNDGIMCTDEEFRIVYMNSASKEMFGWRLDEIAGQTPDVLNADPVADKMQSDLYDTVSSGKSFLGEALSRRKDGTTFYCQFKVTRLYSIDGLITGYMAIQRDITERKQAEEALRRSEQNYGFLMNSTDQAIAFYDLENNLVLINRVGAANLGGAPEDFIGKNISELLPDFEEANRNAIDTIVKTGETIRKSDLVEIETGSKRFYTEINPVIDHNSNIIGVQHVSSDITERKQTEDKLKESEERYRSFVENFQGVAFRGGMDFIPIFFHGAVEEITGYTQDDFVTGELSFDQIVHPDDIDLYHECAMQALSDPAQSAQMEHRIIRKNGEVRWIQQTATVIFDEHGKPLYVDGTLYDITERKQTEEKLRENEESLRQAQSIAHVGNWEWNIEDDCFVMSDEMCRIYGITDPQQYNSMQDMMDKSVHPDDEEWVMQTTRDLAASGTGPSLVFRIVRPDGDVRWIEAMTPEAKTTNADGSLLVILGTVQDITERKQAEMALRESEERYRALFDNTVMPITVWDFDLRFLLCNSIAARNMGESSQSIIGKTVYETIPEIADIIVDRINSILATGIGEQFEDKLTLPTSKEHWFWSDIQPLKNVDGDIYAFQVISEDMTERKQVEEELRESENSLRQAQGIAHLGSFRLDLDTNIIHASEEMLNIYGLAPDVSGKLTVETWQTLVHPDDLDRVSIALGNTATDGAPYNIEFRIYTTDGEMRIVHAQGELVRDASGTPVRMVGTGLDITERKRAEEEIRQINEELEQRVIDRTTQLDATNKELEAFSHSVSHDLKAPARRMESFTKLLLEDYAEILPEKGKHYIDRILSSSRNMSELVESMLQLSRLSSKEMEWEQVNLSAIAQKTAAALQESDPKRKVSFTIEDDLTVNGDEHLLSILLHNLMENGWKFTNQKRDAIIEFGKMQYNGKPALFIRDNGSGFDMDHVDNLFAPFKRLHVESEYSGTGIGLATAKRIVNRHGGSIWGEGQPEKGATFYFSI